MRLLAKLKLLADAAKYDASCASSGVKRAALPGGIGHADGTGICHSYTPDGRCVSLLKILLTNYCIFECRYCVNRASSDIPRARFTSEEVIRLTLDFYRRNYIEGLFLSSGIIQSPDYTMEQLVAVAKGLRTRHAFGGYIHLKTIPGASADLLEQAGIYADRLSVNIELPTAADLERLAPEKNLDGIRTTMGEVRARADAALDEVRTDRRAPRYAPAGQTTQMIVGATPTPDATVLDMAASLYQQHRLRRIYYSAFSPIPSPDAQLATTDTPLVREHRLYEADWLMRFYGFQAAELTTADQPNLDLSRDPKHAWALRHPELFPVDINTAAREMLLRIPGIGYRNVKRILAIRRHHRLTLADLTRLRVAISRATPFIVTADFTPRVNRATVQPPAQQYDLFAPVSALAGEL